MLFKEVGLKGAYLIELEPFRDDRGFFARSWCRREFEAQGLEGRFVQANVSFNKQRGTLRGMHYQAAPYAEVKLVRCTRGAIYDVIIDLRPESESFGKWMGFELTADNYRMVYVPEGFAHGFETLEDSTEVTYQVSEFYNPSSEGGIRYDDPAFGIRWPEEVRVISRKDMAWPDYRLPPQAERGGT
ncbi:MAG TPA: dTDP-4-dehydrorhamnose 3,5-epimerase [candidate division Zixibacteria bacterium]|nr:dTDP-4-dehydrorhamnose 3,5-epimerase [candidate division Zixibacteria bacterium]